MSEVYQALNLHYVLLIQLWIQSWMHQIQAGVSAQNKRLLFIGGSLQLGSFKPAWTTKALNFATSGAIILLCR